MRFGGGDVGEHRLGSERETLVYNRLVIFRCDKCSLEVDWV